MSIVARSQYDERPVLVSDLDFSNDKGVTKQADSKDCDINLMFKRFERTGMLPDMILREPRYGDYSDCPTFEEAFAIVKHAEEQFMNLDAPVRNRFDNDPAKFLAFATDPKNMDEMEKMGLLKPEVVEARAKERIEKGKVEAERLKVLKEQGERELIEKIKGEITK